MDGAYFVGRKELLDFFNNLLDLNFQKIEQTASGAMACQICDIIFPGSIPMQKINWSAKSDYEFIQNYKLLQNAFDKHNVARHVDVPKLIRAKYQDNLEFCQWLKAFYDQTGSNQSEAYDPLAARCKGKGGKTYEFNRKGSVSGGSSRPRSTLSARNPVTARPTASAVATSRAHRPLRERNEDSKPSTSNTSSRVANTSAATSSTADPKLQQENLQLKMTNQDLEATNKELQDQNVELAKQNEELLVLSEENTLKVEELEVTSLEIEKERDFYFSKLRNIEIMLQVHQEQPNDPDHLVEKIFKILYAEMDDNLIVDDEGEVVEASMSGQLDDVLA